MARSLQNMRVPYELTVVQVKDGTDYKGHIKFGETTILYEMVFTISIPRLETALEKPTMDDMKRLFQITLRKEDEPIALTDDEYILFLRMLLMEVAGFPQTRDTNEQMGSGLRNIPGFSMQISTTQSGEYDLPQEIIDILNQPKFDCALAA
jgi:hypothetical protein